LSGEGAVVRVGEFERAGVVAGAAGVLSVPVATVVVVELCDQLVWFGFPALGAGVAVCGRRVVVSGAWWTGGSG